MSDVSITALVAKAREAVARSRWFDTGEEPLIAALADALEESEKRRNAALSLLDTIYGADADILNGRPEMDAAEEKALALRLLRDYLTGEKEL